MSIAELNRVMQRYGITAKHVHLATGLDVRTVKKALAGGQVYFSTCQTIEQAVLKLVQQQQVSPQEPKRSTG